MRHEREMDFVLDDGRIVYFDYSYDLETYHYGSDADGRRGETRTTRDYEEITNIFVELPDGTEGVELSALHPDDQVDVANQIDNYLEKWSPES